MKNTDVFYSLEIADIQSVAQDSVGRDLSNAEIKKVVAEVEKRIAWHDVIDDVISEVVHS